MNARIASISPPTPRPTTLSCRMDARLSGGEGAFSPGFNRASLARPPGRLHAPRVRSAAVFPYCTGPSIRSPRRRWSNIPCRSPGSLRSTPNNGHRQIAPGMSQTCHEETHAPQRWDAFLARTGCGWMMRVTGQGAQKAYRIDERKPASLSRANCGSFPSRRYIRRRRAPTLPL
jgi:hypothetical protein